MLQDNKPNTGPVGIRVTLDAIYTTVVDTERRTIALERMIESLNSHENRIRKLENQASATYVIVGILIAAITTMVARVFGAI